MLEVLDLRNKLFEVSDLHHEAVVEEDILGLDVAVAEPLRAQVGQRLYRLQEEGARDRFSQCSLVDEVEERLLLEELED